MRSGRLLFVISAVLGGAGCGHPRVASSMSRSAGVRGTAVVGQHIPVPWPVVLVTQASDGAFVAVGVGDENGAFDVPLPTGSYALTITSGAGFARLSPYVASLERDVFQLKSDCSRVSGRVSGEVLAGEVVWLRAMTPPHDYFGARVGGEGRYELCVPVGEYNFDPDDGSVTVPTYVEVPRPESLDVVAYRVATVKQTLESREAVSKPLIGAISVDVRVVGLGESNHGSAEFVFERERVTRQLHAQKGFRYVMLEAGAGEVMALNEYVQGKTLDVRAAVSRLGYWMWDVEEFLAVLESIRKYNAGLAPDDRVQLLGLDVQNTEGAVEAILGAKKEFKLDESQIALLSELRIEAGARALELPPEKVATLRALLERLGEVSTSASEKRVGLMLAARSLIHRLSMLESKEGFPRLHARDRGMADMVLSLIRAEPDAKAVLWAHDAHVGKTPWEGFQTMGEHLQAELGDAYYAVALLSYAGEVRAWDEAVSVGVIAHVLKPAPEHSVEGAIAARSEDSIVEVPFDDAPTAFQDWLRTYRYAREFGAVYSGETFEFVLRSMLQTYDGAIVVRNSSPTHPTATGVRTKSVAPTAN